jgi:hypothetical protein
LTATIAVGVAVFDSVAVGRGVTFTSDLLTSVSAVSGVPLPRVPKKIAAITTSAAIPPMMRVCFFIGIHLLPEKVSSLSDAHDHTWIRNAG